MNRKLTLIAITAGLLSLSACNVVQVVDYTDRVVEGDVRPVDSSLLAPGDAECEGANCPTPPPVSYPCVSGSPEGAIVEGAGSVICP